MRSNISVAVATMLMGAGVPAVAGVADEGAASTDRATVVVTARAVVPASPDIYGTVALDAGVTAYGARWRRVSAADERDPRIVALAASFTEGGALERLSAVHREIGRRIAWRRDLDTYRISDYWAQAGETLSRREGDSEDIAILKMQVLKAAGFAARDLYLSVGRDAARGADAILVVRVEDEFYALDDRIADPILARSAKHFEPVITLGRGSAWIHGRRVLRTAARQASRRGS